MSLKNKFTVGEIVTFITHPLLYNFKIESNGKSVPPLMIVKEVFFENKKKKIFDEETGNRIAERIKYTCTYFDDIKSEFKEVIIYESMLESFKKLYIARLDGKKKSNEEGYESLRTEVLSYKNPKYKFGEIINFKTKKLEILKKRSSMKIIVELKGEKEDKLDKKVSTTEYVTNYTTPEFVLSGLKKEKQEDLFYPNGDKKRLVSETLYKVKWFNHYQMKFSEQYLPIECFIDKFPFETKESHIAEKK